eukprot:3716008-Amphidinium_carterae.2
MNVCLNHSFLQATNAVNASPVAPKQMDIFILACGKKPNQKRQVNLNGWYRSISTHSLGFDNISTSSP